MKQLDPFYQDYNDLRIGSDLESLTDHHDELLEVEWIALGQGSVDLVLEQIVDRLGPILHLRLDLVDQIQHLVKDIFEHLRVIEYGLLDDLDYIE